MFDSIAKRGVAAVLLAAFTACSGGSGAPIPRPGEPSLSSPAAASTRRKAVAHFFIKIPKKHHRARYISPATQSLTLAIAPQGGGAPVVNETVNVTPTSPGCSSTPSATQCVLNVSLFAGSYFATVATYDQVGAGGNELSHGQSVPFAIAAGRNNVIGLTLNGIPHALLIAAGARAVHGSQSEGFAIYGSSAQPLVVTATDADGNAIVGAGAPSYAPSILSGSAWSVAPPAQGKPGTFSVTPPGTNGSGAVLKVTATYTDATCALAGADCSTTISVKNDMQTLFVSNFDANNVLAFALPNTGSPAATISSGVFEPLTLALDAYNNLFVANLAAGSVTEYAPPYGGAAIPITTGTDIPQYLAQDSAGNLFVATRSNNSAYIFAPPYSSAVQTYNLGANEPNGMAVDSAGNLFVSIESSNEIREFVPPYSLGPPHAIITTGLNRPHDMVLDAAGNLFVLNFNTGNVLEYSPPFSGSSAPVATIGAASNLNLEALAIDGTGDLFVAACDVSCGGAGLDSVLEYAPPYTGTPVTITNGILFPAALALDGAGNLFVANSSNVTEYAPPYTGAPVATINGFAGAGPGSMVLTP